MSELENITYSRVWIDDVLLQDEGISVLINSDEPSLPSVRNLSVTVPGRHGSYDFGAFFEPREFTLNCVYDRQNYNELKSSLQVLNSLLLDDFGRPKTVRLRFGDEPDKYFIARLSDGVPVERRSDRGFISVNLTAFDPYKYSKVTADEVTWGSEDITFEADYLLGHENDFADEYVKITGNDTLVTSVSGIAIKPTFMINGTANNLTVSANGHYFSLPNFTNVRWEIDFEKYLVRRNGQETMLEINDFYLMPGSNEISITGSNINIEMAIKYHDKYN